MKVHCVTGIGLDSNIYIVESEKALIIDTGTGMYSGRILKKLDELGLKGKVECIVLTHRHIDHVGGAVSLVKELKCKILTSEKEAAALRPGNEASTCAPEVGMNLPGMDARDIGDSLSVGDMKFDDLDLLVWRLGPDGQRELAAHSISEFNNVEHLCFELPQDGNYEITVLLYGQNYDLGSSSPFMDDYGLAWSVTPEPGTIAFFVFGGMGLLAVIARRRAQPAA